MKELVAISGDDAALRARFAGRAQRLADYNHIWHERGGFGAVESGAAFNNLEAANRAVARTNIGKICRAPTGDERAINNLEPNYDGERRKAGHQEFVNLLTACSNFRPRARGGS